MKRNAKYDIKFLIEGQIEVLFYSKRELLQVQWVTSPKNDLTADSVCLLILQIKENKMRWTVLVFVLCAFCSKQVQCNGNKNCSTSFLESTPFFQKCPTRFKSQQILFLTEFSRFMNTEVPNMLKVSFLLQNGKRYTKRHFEKFLTKQ